MFISGPCVHSQKCRAPCFSFTPTKSKFDSSAGRESSRRWSQRRTGMSRSRPEISGARCHSALVLNLGGDSEDRRNCWVERSFSRFFSNGIDRQIVSANYRLIFGLSVMVLSRLGTGILQWIACVRDSLIASRLRACVRRCVRQDKNGAEKNSDQ